MKSFNLSLKLVYLFCVFILAYFVLKPSEAATATLESISLWAHKVLPNIFSFGIISNIAVNMNLLSDIGFINIVLKSLKISKGANAPYALSLICASPLSVKCVCDSYSDGLINQEDAQHLLILCSTLSPLFVYSSIGILMYGKFIYALSMLLTNYIGVYLSAYFYNLVIPKNNLFINQQISEKKSSAGFFATFTKAITDSSITAINIGGFIVFFGVVVNALSDFGLITNTSLFGGIITLFTEITSGANILKNYLTSHESVVISLSYATLGFGGCCFLKQNISFITKTNLYVKRFVLFKVFNAIIDIFIGNLILLLLKLILYI